MQKQKKMKSVLMPMIILIVVIAGLYKLIEYFYGRGFLG